MEVRRPSHERRTSRRSFRNSYGSSIDSNQSELSLSTAERKLQKILDAEEHELIVLYVREELLANVINQCYDRYIERQCVDFTVHCAYRALKQFVDLGCFLHDPGKPFYTEHPAWLPDNPPITSPPDTWAARRIAVKPKRKLSVLKVRPSEIDEQFKEVKFNSAVSDFTQDDSQKDEGVEILYEAELMKGCRRLSQYDSEIGLIGPPGSIVSSIDEDDYGAIVEEEDEEKTRRKSLPESWSFFTRIAKVSPQDLPGSLKSFQLPRKSKVIEGEPLSLDDLSEKPQLSVGVLPPLRSEIHCSKTKLPQKNKEELKVRRTSKKNSE